ncbi:putative chorismate mutase [Pseudomonas putida S610]|uniref:chorismate mutase n=1 Tax=Pseudomonas putida TaxID=303 RepID=UPI0003C59DAC|nr:chorismate mutase [Pseudomonas putida]EST17175.1 putative chorismate mutase [Pseudomonas putida S610]
MRNRLLCLLTAFSLSGCTAASPQHPALDPLLDTIEQRLAIAQAVALHKWDKGQPVQATDREQAVLARVQMAAPGLDLAPHDAEAFFVDQMEANKLVQYTLLYQWRLAGQAPDDLRTDLQTVIRPELDRLETKLLEQLAAFRRQDGRACGQRVVSAIASRPSAPLMKQAMIRATGQLCDPL